MTRAEKNGLLIIGGAFATVIVGLGLALLGAIFGGPDYGKAE
jgi:hypothetical protein